MGGQLAGREHHAVTRRQGGDGRCQGQLHRVVPWRYHAHHTQRLALDVCAGRLQKQGRTHPAGLHPLGQVAQRVRQQGTQHKEVRHLGEAGRTHAKVGLHGRCQQRAMLVEHFGNAQQPLAAHQQWHIHMRAARLALKIEMGVDVGGCHGRIIGDTPMGASQKGGAWPG